VPGCNKVLRAKAVQFRMKRTGYHLVIPAGSEARCHPGNGFEPESMFFIFSKAKKPWTPA